MSCLCILLAQLLPPALLLLAAGCRWGLCWRSGAEEGSFQSKLGSQPPSPLTVPGTNNSFHTQQTGRENTTNPSSPRHHLAQGTMEKTQYSQERQATFPFGQTLPLFLLFSSPKKDIWGRRRSYRLQIYSTSKQRLTAESQEDLAFSWAR